MSGIKTRPFTTGTTSASTSASEVSEIDDGVASDVGFPTMPPVNGGRDRALSLIDGKFKQSMSLPPAGNTQKPLTPRAQMSEAVVSLIDRVIRRDVPAEMPAVLDGWTSGRIWS